MRVVKNTQRKDLTKDIETLEKELEQLITLPYSQNKRRVKEISNKLIKARQDQTS